MLDPGKLPRQQGSSAPRGPMPRFMHGASACFLFPKPPRLLYDVQASCNSAKREASDLTLLVPRPSFAPLHFSPPLLFIFTPPPPNEQRPMSSTGTRCPPSSPRSRAAATAGPSTAPAPPPPQPVPGPAAAAAGAAAVSSTHWQLAAQSWSALARIETHRPVLRLRTVEYTSCRFV